MNDAMRLIDAKHRAERVTDREIEIVNRLLSEYAVYIDDSEVAHGTLDEIIDFLNNAVCKFFNKKSVQIVEANSHISG